MEVTISGKAKTIEQGKEGSKGSINISPGQVVTITNTDTDPVEQVTFNVTGSAHKSTLANGNVQTVMTGRNFALDPVAGTFISIGRFTFVNDPTDTTNVIAVSGTGRMIDVCALLAPPPEEAE